MKMTKYVSDWFARADDDLVLVKLILDKGTGSPNLACFHAQQVAEKYLKGFLAHRDLHVRKIHDLAMLAEECAKVEPSFSYLRDDARYLNQFYIESRYPDDFILFERDDAEKALEAALRVKEFVLARIAETNEKQRGFGIAAVIIIAAVALLGGGLWYVRTLRTDNTEKTDQSQESSVVPSTAEIDTSDWKTYRNEEYGFELRYPGFLVTADTFGTIPNGLKSIYFRNPEVVPTLPRFFVRVFQDEGTPIEMWIRENPDAYLYDSDTRFSRKESITVDGVQGFIIGEPQDPVPDPVVLLPKDDLIFIIGFFAKEDKNLLSTFRFVR